MLYRLNFTNLFLKLKLDLILRAFLPTSDNAHYVKLLLVYMELFYFGINYGQVNVINLFLVILH